MKNAVVISRLYVVALTMLSVVMFAPQVEAQTTGGYTLTIDSPQGQGTVTSNPPNLIFNGTQLVGLATFPANTSIMLTAQPAPGWEFSSWVEYAIDPEITLGTTPNFTITLTDKDRRVRPVFTPTTGGGDDGGGTTTYYKLTTNTEGAGTINLNPSTPDGSYAAGTQVTFTNAPATGWTFAGWRVGEGSSLTTTPELGIQMTRDLHVVAVFTQTTGGSGTMHTLTVTTQGLGRVMRTNGEISGSVEFPEGFAVSMHAIPNEGWTFSGWLDGVTNQPIGSNGNIQITMSSDRSVIAVFTQTGGTTTYYTLSTTVQGRGAVSSSPSAPTSIYAAGTSVALTANPESGWTFSNWSGIGISGGTSTQNPLTVVMNSNQNITAVFTETTSPIISVRYRVDGNNGIIRVQDFVTGREALTRDTVLLSSLTMNTNVTAMPQTAPFMKWSDDYTNHTRQVTADFAHGVTEVIAYFGTSGGTTFALTTDVEGQGTINRDPSTADGSYAAGTSVTLTNTPAAGWTFTGWRVGTTGSNLITTPEYQVTMTRDLHVVAVFTETTSPVTSVRYRVDGNGGIIKVQDFVTGQEALTRDTVLQSSLTMNTNVTAQPQTAPFIRWSDGFSNHTRQVTADFNMGVTEVIAYFGTGGGDPGTPIRYSTAALDGGTTNATLRIWDAARPTETERITRDTVLMVTQNSPIRIQPMPNPVTVPFARWSDYSTNPVRQAAADLAEGLTDVTAYFGTSGGSGTMYTLTVTTQGDGRVTRANGGGEISGSVEFQEGSVVSMDAIPDNGWTFSGWFDGATNEPIGSNGRIQITMGNDRSVRAVFTETTGGTTYYTLSTAVNGDGTISSSPSAPTGIYAAGTSVALTATPLNGWTFSNWSGVPGTPNGTSAQNPLTVVMNDNYQIAAVFTQTTQTYTLSVAIQGQGTFTGNPGVINMTSPSFAFPANTNISLFAQPAQGWTFSNWLDAETGAPIQGTGSGNAIAITITNRDRSVIAVFTQAGGVTTYTLTTTTQGQGTVTGNPAIIDPATRNPVQFPAGTQVTLTANPASGWTFSNWTGLSGSATGASANPTTVTMNSNHQITAVFTQIAVPVPFTFTYTAGSNGKIRIGSSNREPVEVTDTTISSQSPQGPSVTAIPNSGSHFVRWSDGNANPARQDVITSTAGVRNLAFRAYFARDVIAENNMLTGGSFADEEVVESWSFETSDKSGAVAEGSVTDDGEFAFNITQAGSAPEDVSFTQDNIAVEPEKTYTLSFMARADAERTVFVIVESGDGFFEKWEITLTTELQEFSRTFVMSNVIAKRMLAKSAASAGALEVSVSFNSGHKAVNWYLSEVNLVEAELHTSVLSSGRMVPQVKPSVEAEITAPAGALAGELTAGPNPVARLAGKVSFFWQGKRIQSASLIVFDAAGNTVSKVQIKDGKDIKDNSGRRIVGSWNLTDSRGRTVAVGTYLVKGVITVDGKKEKVSLMIGVR